MFNEILISGLSLLMLFLNLSGMLTLRKPVPVSNDFSNNNFLHTKIKR